MTEVMGFQEINFDELMDIVGGSDNGDGALGNGWYFGGGPYAS